MFRSYFNLQLKPSQDIPQWDVLGRAWREIHRAGARYDIPFAVAFPDWMKNGFTTGNTLRVFTIDEEQATRLCDAAEPVLEKEDVGMISRIRVVPSDVSAWEAYRMHRLSGPVSKNRKSIAPEIAAELRNRARERQIIQQKSLPFVRMRSSKGHGFKLVVERIAANPSQQGRPNGYGLSRASQIIALPVL